MNWTFSDKTGAAVFRISEDGCYESRSINDAEVQAWLSAGNEPLPYVPPPPAPITAVTMRQARLALLGAGLLDDINAAIDSLPSPQKEAARIEWEYSQEVQRHNGFVSLLAPTLGLTEPQLDELFATAATL